MFNKIILHIPHASSSFDFARQEELETVWRRMAEPLIDWYTDELFMPSCHNERVIPIVFDTCRTLVDVERMCHDPLESKGLGITAYSLLQGHKVRESIEEDIRYMKKYLDHHHRLANLLVEHHNSLIIDCHSFSSRPTVLQPDVSRNHDVDICIGFNDDIIKPDKDTLDIVEQHFSEKGYKVSFNIPYSNSKTVETPAIYKSLMIEINKSLYMDECTLQKNAAFESLKYDIESLYKKLLQ